jgi:hypothetical protein
VAFFATPAGPSAKDRVRTLRTTTIRATLLLLMACAWSASAQDLPALLQGLTALQSRKTTTDEALKIAQAKRDAEAPSLRAEQVVSDEKKSDIYANHNNVHETGSSEFLYWNAKYSEASAESARLANEIARLEKAVADLMTTKEQIALERQQKVRAIIDLLRARGAACANALSEDSSDDLIAHCGQVDFDGQARRLPTVESLGIEQDKYFKGDPSVVELDSDNAQAAAAKRRRIAELIRISSATHSTRPVVVTPPSPGTSGTIEPSLSDRLIRFLKGL